MIPRVFVFVLLLATGGVIPAEAKPARSAPTRPESPAQTITIPITVGKFPDYVPVEEFAKLYGLEPSWLVPQRRLLLKGANNRIEIEAGSREMRVNGMRVFLGDPSRMMDGALRVSRVDGERLLAGLLQPAKNERAGLKVIALDPGHGGALPGTLNAKLGLQEKVLALDVSIRLRKLLEARGYRVVMTRETDIDVSWGARAIIANEAKADLFISIHFNATLNDAKTHGVEVFTFAPQFQRSTNAWGAGQVDDTEALPAPVNRFDMLSVASAHAIHRALLAGLKADDRGQKIAHWRVLRPLNCPGVLVEAGFLSHDAEAKKIATPEYRQRIAEAIAEGVGGYARAIGAAAAAR